MQLRIRTLVLGSVKLWIINLGKNGQFFGEQYITHLMHIRKIMQTVRFINDIKFVLQLWVYGTVGFYYAMKFIGYGDAAVQPSTE